MNTPMKEANQKLQHEMSSIHQTLNSEAKILERYLKYRGIEDADLWETINVLKRTCEKSKAILKKHYEETGVPINAEP